MSYIFNFTSLAGDEESVVCNGWVSAKNVQNILSFKLWHDIYTFCVFCSKYSSNQTSQW